MRGLGKARARVQLQARRAEVWPLRGLRLLGSSYISHVLGHARLALASVRGFRGRFSEPPPWPQAPRARWGAVMKRAGRVCFVGLVACAPSPGRVSSAARFAALAVVVGLAASGRKASSVVCARFTPAPPLSARLRRQNGGRGLAWLVVRGLVGVPVLRAAAPPLLVHARLFGRVARGGPRRFIPEALAPGNARASGRFVRRGRCHGPCFSPLAKTALGFATPGSFCESRARQSAVQPSLEVVESGRNHLREERRDRGEVNSAWPWSGQRERS